MTDEHDPDAESSADDAMFMRTFELDGEPTVEAWVWPPEEDEDMQTTRCYYQIVGMGDEKFRSAYGVDGLQALTTAMNFIAVHLYNSPEYLDGRLTLYGKRDLFLPELPGWRLGDVAREPATVFRQGVGASIVALPQERFAHIAFGAVALRGAAEVLETGSKSQIRRLARSLRETLTWYEGVCKEEALTLPYFDKPKT
jgi:hypothetical protein